MNDSSTGGYLTPENTILDDTSLKRFLHDVLVGITALPNELVRPAYQTNPPTIPDVDVDWCAFYISNRRVETLPWATRIDDDNDCWTTNEFFDLVATFYGPNCMSNSGILRDGLHISQNLEQLVTVGIALTDTQDILYTGELVNDRYYERADITINLNRDVSRTYKILTLLGVQGTIQVDDTTTENFSVGGTP